MSDEAATAEEVSWFIEPIVQQLAQLGSEGWQEFSAEFPFTRLLPDRPAAVDH